jgi:release factor glutamine methyltransferase
MQVKDLLRQTKQRLEDAGITDAELEASLLLAHLLGVDKVRVHLSGQDTLNSNDLGLFEALLTRRLNREPLAYILGSKEFWSLEFNVSKNVLIPRPETEFLVETVLQVFNYQANSPNRSFSILDLGTGSGVIAIVLAREIQSASVLAIDYSEAALQVAVKNAAKHGVSDRVHFLNSDWFAAIKPGEKFDLVVSNPPYVAREILDKPCGNSPDALEPEVVGHEPRMALDGGLQGLQSIIQISDKLLSFLKPGGWFFMEIGADQAAEVVNHFNGIAEFGCIKVYEDYAGLPRVFQARKEE